MKFIIIRRVIHSIFGHPYDGSTLTEKLTSEKHEWSSKDNVYTVNIMKCKCGLTFHDIGCEGRERK